MEKEQIIKIQKKVAELLANKRLKQAIDKLGETVGIIQDWELRTRYTEIQTAYTYMLDYLRSGMPDPDRAKLYNELTGRCYIINDLVAVAAESELSRNAGHRNSKNVHEQLQAIYENLKENCSNIGIAESMPDEESKTAGRRLSEEHERLIEQLFNTLQSSTSWSKGCMETTCRLVRDNGIALNDRATAVSAITLSAMNCFEPAKAIALCNMATYEEERISTRAIVGLIIVMFRYKERIAYYPELMSAISMLQEEKGMINRVQTIQIQLLRSRETQKIDRKMRDEIIPAMMKNPKIRREKFSIDILKEIEENEDKNPEWEKWLEHDNIKDKVEEIAKWQTEGADVYMSTFSQLKKFPFFYKMHNWFRPFDPKMPDIADIMQSGKPGSKTLPDAICSSQFFCNSDKYSFCFTFKQIPQEQREMLMGQIEGEDAASQELETKAMAPKEKKAEIESNQYIQDLYRFFKLSDFSNRLFDPFGMSLNLLECKPLAPLVENGSTTRQMFQYLMEKEYYSEAYKAGLIYSTYESGDAQFYQEMGYCMQKEHEYNKAIDYYTKADIIKPDTLWTLRHIAQCYRLQGEFDKAVDYYIMAEELAPENISLLLQTGESLAAMKRYDEAFPRFYKAEYLKPESRRAIRAIAWCSFLVGKDTQAQSYYKRLLGLSSPSFEDYLNAAHVEWSQGNNAEAVELYRRAAGIAGADEVAAHIMKDRDILEKHGISVEELLLIRDLLY